MVYEWKAAAHIRCSADEAGKLFERLEDTVGLTPETVLEAAKDETSPIHSEFEWDDDTAAEKYRLYQAGHLIRCLCVKSEQGDKPPVRAYFKVTDSGYEETKRIIAIQEKRVSLLKQALSELRAFKRKYSALNELSEVFTAIDSVEDENE